MATAEIGARDFRRRPQEIVDEGVHRGFHGTPGARTTIARNAMPGLAVLTDDLAGALQLARQALIRADDLVERVGDLAGKAGLVACQPDGEIAVANGLQSSQ